MHDGVRDSEIEIRQVFEMEDFAPLLSEEQIHRKVAKRLSCQIRPPTNSRSCIHGLRLV